MQKGMDKNAGRRKECVFKEWERMLEERDLEMCRGECEKILGKE